MGPQLGTDEAGFGPNLGPLVVAVTRWDGAAGPLREVLAEVCSEVASPDRLHLADSKEVHKPGGTELSVSAAGVLAAAGIETRSLRGLVRSLAPGDEDPLAGVPWFEADDVERVEDGRVARFAEAVQSIGISLQVRASVVPAGTYNAALDRWDSKGALLSHTTLTLLNSLWEPGEAADVVCDKHGGRNRYGPLLVEQCGGTVSGGLGFGVSVETVSEAKAESRYRVGDSDVRFCMRAERFLPVACASLVAKWVRERSMRAFNTWWGERLPHVRPTLGYPNDAKRWLAEAGRAVEENQIDLERLWRKR